jgi:ABC-type lipoprotein export system ATPase subunit
MIKITNLEKIYRTEEVETVALNKLSMQIAEGEFVAVMGPSGCGKSTLLDYLMTRMTVAFYSMASKSPVLMNGKEPNYGSETSVLCFKALT